MIEKNRKTKSEAKKIPPKASGRGSLNSSPSLVETDLFFQF